MPRIFDNIESSLLTALRETLQVCERADFCVGYFNLRGWKALDSQIESWAGGDDHCCRLLVGMQRLPSDASLDEIRFSGHDDGIDNQSAILLKRRLAKEFSDQLSSGAPTNEDEAGLQRLARQIKSKKVRVKLFLRHALHAKLYLLFRPDRTNPIIGYLGSSNLTLSGLSHQGELNIDVMDHDACKKLAAWFDERWNDRWCVDISDELVQIIDESWAREELIPPYHIYIKMAYHLSLEARTGLSEFQIPPEFRGKLLAFQTAAVKIAAHHLNKRNGVLIGDVVGLGKTLMATAVAKIFEEDHDLETLIICPTNLRKMWEDYREHYRLRGRVLPLSLVTKELPDLRRYRLVLLDESHNLRNRQGRRFRVIQEYIAKNDSKCMLLSATPYNKTYLDLASQLSLFVPEDFDLGIRPENLIREIGETEFIRRHQCGVRTIAAFEKSEYPDDWRELMRLYMVRRTRSFIKDNYAKLDEATNRRFLSFDDGSKFMFPERRPRRVKFKINEKDPNDQYARLYSARVVVDINRLELPRYGLANYILPNPRQPPTSAEAVVLANLSRAGKRLMGFCRTNLFKRLESGGQTFLQSIERHVLRNYVFLHAIMNGLPVPIGTQDAELLDARAHDEDADRVDAVQSLFDEIADSDESLESPEPESLGRHSDREFRIRASEIYQTYANQYQRRFNWLRPGLFVESLEQDILADIQILLNILANNGEWNPDRDSKLKALQNLLTKDFPDQKILIFTQFADTARYLEYELKRRGVGPVALVCGGSSDPTELAWRFSPVSNDKRDRIARDKEVRVLVATDVLSEGQNLQDASIVVNYDLPWAIIRLIQRAGRVDRIGQKAAEILCYTFWPADGVERIIQLRSRVRQRLRENREVVGTDEAFFEDDADDQAVLDLYNEKSGLLDQEDDTEVDLASKAYEIWKRATEADPSLLKTIPDLAPVSFATKSFQASEGKPNGVLLYVRTAAGNDALAWVDKSGKSVTESQLAILRGAECTPETPALPRQDDHHKLVRRGIEQIIEEEKTVGGQLGRPSGARFRTYERLMRHAGLVKGTLFESPGLLKAIDEIYRFPLRPTAADTLNRQIRAGIDDEDLAGLVIGLRDEDRLCVVQEDDTVREPQIICSMGLSDQ
jgi:superfamily II DNA or RNA helicase